MLYTLVELLPKKLQAYAKAVVAGLIGALAPFVITGWLTGEWDKAGIIGAISGFLLTPSVFATPNVLPVKKKRRAAGEAGNVDVIALVAITALALAILALAGVRID